MGHMQSTNHMLSLAVSISLTRSNCSVHCAVIKCMPYSTEQQSASTILTESLARKRQEPYDPYEPYTGN